eukprot:3057136-Amphidinium_carterae.5
MDSEEHLIAARTAGVVRCRTVRQRPIQDQHDQQMLLAMQGTPWDAKGRLATPIPMMGGMQATATTAKTASSGGAVGSTERVKNMDESLLAQVPDNVPEDGEPDVEGALPRPEKRARGRPRKRIGEITDVVVTVPMERNELDYSNIDPDLEQYHNLVDEDNDQPLDAQRVAEGVRREMKFLDEQRLGEPYLRSKEPEKAVVTA